ncbi:hypothetical protein AVEN_274620-1 [Araneus ventricosus]|uniref:Polynucleotide 5'-hydroxyl-kinase NOL9 n=1 Tax=Araneus ventricosus TaxID=182803 RepID=A0A4Y2L4J7_ARAVE|nr:hypothetical protein AVEN_274620-1 [Araneus ventricosus]
MAKRKLKPRQKASDDESESQRPAKQFKKRNNSSTENISSSKEEHDSSGDSDICDLGETSCTTADDTHYESFSSFLKAFSYYYDDNDDEHTKCKGASNEGENSMIDSKRSKSHEEASHPASSSHENVVIEEIETNIRILPIPSMLSELVVLQHPASLTLHGYVEVTIWFGNIRIFGYKVQEGETIKVFSTEGTGLKKVKPSRPKQKLDIEVLKKDLKKLTCYEKINLEGFINDIGPSSVVLSVKKILLPAPLRFLEQYYPTALQTRWFRSETSEKEKNFKLCSTEKSYAINVSGDFKMLSRQVNEVVSNPDFGPRILVRGEKNMGKSTLIRYLMNSCLNNVDEVYFLDTDPGQTEYTPPGVVSIFRVTKPLLGNFE